MDINRYSPSYILDKKHLIGLSDYSTEEIFELLFYQALQNFLFE